MRQLSRRAFLRSGTLYLAGAAAFAGEEKARKPALRVGLLTDLHYGDKKTAGTRHYRESVPKLQEAVARFQAVKPAFVVELGDFIDRADDVKTELGYLRRIEKEFAALACPRHYVLGNHCVDTLTKEEFLENTGARRPYYSFDAGGFHFVVLDACFRADGKPYGRKNFTWTDTNVPPAELEWLAADLAATKRRTVVFVHQRLDVENHYGVRNAAKVRGILEKSGRVLAVFCGHNHKNDLKEISRIHYCTLAAMVEGSGAENSAYGLLDIHANGDLRVTGFRKQESHSF